jgi:hypothetical protein
VLWIAFISTVFYFPELNPVNSQTFNYAPVAVGIVLTYALGFWALSSRTPGGGSREADRSSSALYSFFVGWVSADYKWSACIELEERMGISVAESVAMSEKPESVEKSSGP